MNNIVIMLIITTEGFNEILKHGSQVLQNKTWGRAVLFEVCLNKTTRLQFVVIVKLVF